ncbi:hypothetical protein ACHAWF_002182 [Thalassiosira exigua]
MLLAACRLRSHPVAASPSITIHDPLRRIYFHLLIFFLLFVVAVKASSIKDKQHLAAIAELKRLVPPPSSGGSSEIDCINDDAYYARFLSINEWDPIKTESSIRQSIQWRKRVQPHKLRPRSCPALCRQYAWLALTTGPGSKSILNDDDKQQQDAARRYNKQPPLDPPYNCPPLQSWRTTKHGFPITYFRCWKWKPELASSEESEKHLAYHIHHSLRRIPNHKNNVSRICVIFDMRGFETYKLPYIHKCINILRCQYPARAGAMCFINAPMVFTTVWKIISPWLDDEIRSKVFFAPREVDDVEKSIGYLNKKKLKAGLF